MTATQHKKEVIVAQDQLKTYKTRSILFGLIKWEELFKTDVISNDLNIFTNGTGINKLFVDGVEIDIINIKQTKTKKEKEHKTDGTKCWCNPKIVKVVSILKEVDFY